MSSIYIKSGTDYYGEYESVNPNANNIVISENGINAKTLLDNFQMNGTGFTTAVGTSTWADTHTTVFNTRALETLVNPEILAIKKAVLITNDITTPTASIGIEADNSGGIGTYYGMNLFNNNNTNFGITSTFPYSGSVVFEEEGGTNTTTTAIKQGLITITDPSIPLATSFNATTLTSGASSATWADIISGTASNTLQEVLTAGNTATSTNIILNNGSNLMVLSPNSANITALENFTPVVPTTLAQSTINIGASSGNIGNTISVQDSSVPQSLQTSGQIITVGDKINDPFNLKPELQLFSQFIDPMGVQSKEAKYQVSGITHQSITPYEINSTSNIGITANNIILTSNNLISTTDTLTLRSPSSGYTSSPNCIIENTAFNAGTTTGVPSVEYFKSGRITVLNDVVMSQQFNARAYNNVKTTFGKIECSITGNSALTGIDGALDFYTCINGVNQNVMRLNGADNENNTFRPFDLNGNALKTSQGNMTIDTTSSTGTGTLTIATKDGTAGSGGGLLLTGNTLLSASASGSSGQHLALTIGGTVYKIALLNN